MERSVNTGEKPRAGGKSGLSAGFLEFLKSHQNERHVIVLQEFPDPDAIAAGLAHQYISSRFNIQADIIYSGRISHQQNLALVSLLNIELSRFEDSVDLSSYDGAVFVDNQGTSAGPVLKALEKASVPALAVVDHHESQSRVSPEFKDIRPDIGAAATIYAQYLKDGVISLDKTDTNHTMIATALTHGIITDTNGLIRAAPQDFYAAAFLSEYRDADLLNKIMNQERSKQTMTVIYRALGSRVTVEGFSIAGIGYLRTEDRDAIPQAADFLISEENVHTAVVYGIVTGEDWAESVIGSLRTSRITIDPDQFIKEVFGRDINGRHFGGGKRGAGGFHIPIGFLSGGGGEQFQEQKWEVFDEQIKQKIFAKIGSSPNKSKADSAGKAS